MLSLSMLALRCTGLATVLGCAAGAAMGQYATNPANCHTYALTPAASTWPAAEAYAQSLGGHLATIRSLSEQMWINNTFLVGPDATHAFWIGLHRVSAGGSFAWSSGETDQFTYWHSGEPNNTCGGEPAVAMNWYISEGLSGSPGDWNDTNDGGVHYQNCGSAGQVPYRGLVEFPAPLVFTAQPSSVSTCPGGSAPFSVAVVGAGPFSYRWQIATNGANWATLGNDPLPLACGGSAHASPFGGPSTQIGLPPPPGLNTYQTPCVVTPPCGDAYSNPATLTICYANCDCSTTSPVLNVLDFGCFLNKFASGDAYANCDGSTTPPVLNVLDFSCFLNAFAAGCP